MEILMRTLQTSQRNFEDALRMEITYDEVNNTKEGKKLLHWIRRRRRIVNHLAKILDKI